MKLSELPLDHTTKRQPYTQLSSYVLCVISRTVMGWCMFIDHVPGQRHDEEWQEVADRGTRVNREVAEAIARTRFYPGFEIDLPYAM